MKRKRNKKKVFFISALLVGVILLTGIFIYRPSNAQFGLLPCCWMCLCQEWEGDRSRDVLESRHEELREHITEEFQQMQIWLANDFFEYMMAPLAMMTENLVTVGMHQMLALGALFDAKFEMETQRLYQQKAAEAHKDYHPSVGMCTFGTNTRSLAAGDNRAEYTAQALSQRSLARQLGVEASSGGFGLSSDRQSRLNQFKLYYCDEDDNARGYRVVCPGAAPDTVNKDVDFTRTFFGLKSLRMNFSDAVVTNDERDVLALANNLYGHNVFDRPTLDELSRPENVDEYLEMRSIIAKRSVAENSFNALAGMKTSGINNTTAAVGPYMRNVLLQLGVDAEFYSDPERQDDAEAIVGTEPSYYEQMEILSQKVYQSPDFFTNLYDKPVNVARKDVSMQAINLMLDRDMYKSELRSEALLAVLLEMGLLELQGRVQQGLDAIGDEGKEDSSP